MDDRVMLSLKECACMMRKVYLEGMFSTVSWKPPAVVLFKMISVHFFNCKICTAEAFNEPENNYTSYTQDMKE